MCAHPRIAGAQHELHWGMHESNIYLNQRYWGDLRRPGRFAAFLDSYAREDYFALAEGDRAFHAANAAADFVDFFFDLMDRYARRAAASHWVTKLDYLYYYRPREAARFIARVKHRYGAFRCIAIRRLDRTAAVESYLSMEGKRRQHRTTPFAKHALMVLHSARLAAQRRGIDTLASRHGALRLTLEDLRDRREESARKICDFLAIPFDRAMLADRYPPNTSFARAKGARSVLSAWERAALRSLLFALWDTLPALGAALLRLREIPKFKNSPLYFRLEMLHENPRKLHRQLLDEGEVGLAQIVELALQPKGP